MSLLDFFKPRWQHSDPEIRVQAVSQLDTIKLRNIAIQTRYEDVFRAAISRISAMQELNTLIDELEQLSIRSRHGWEIIKLRQQILVERISDPQMLIRIASTLPPEVALKALAKLDAYHLSSVLSKTESEIVRQAVIARIRSHASKAKVPRTTSENYVTATDIDISTIGIQELAKDKQAVTYGIDAWDLRKRLEALFDGAVRHQDWQSAKFLISKCKNPEIMVELILRLPGTEIGLDQLREIDTRAQTQAKYTPTTYPYSPYTLLQPIIKKMKQNGWIAQEETVEEICKACNGNGAQGNSTAPLDRDVDSYPCGSCDSKGRIRIISIHVCKGVEVSRITTKYYL